MMMESQPSRRNPLRFVGMSRPLMEDRQSQDTTWNSEFITLLCMEISLYLASYMFIKFNLGKIWRYLEAAEVNSKIIARVNVSQK